MARQSQNAIMVDGQRFKLTAAVASVTAFLGLFSNLGKDPEGKAKPRSGYDKYFNDDGFVNPQSPKSLSAQGVGKLMAVLFETAHEIIAQGGAEGTEMEQILAGVLAYNDVAATEIKAKREDSAMQAALAVVGPEKLAEFLAKSRQNVPPAVVETADETTVENEEAVEAA